MTCIKLIKRPISAICIKLSTMSALLGTLTGIRIAVALGLSGSAWCSGNVPFIIRFVFSALLVSFKEQSCLSQPSPVQPRSAHFPPPWAPTRHLYNRGKKTMPPIAATTALAYAYAAWSIPNPLSLDFIQQTRNLFTLGGILTVLIVPYTLLLMQKTNSTLSTKLNASKAKSDKGVTGEMRKLRRSWEGGICWMQEGRCCHWRDMP